MEAASIFERLQKTFADQVTEVVTDNPDPYVVVSAEALPQVAAFAKGEADLDFDFLESITGVDEGDKLRVVYHLFSYKHRHALVLKTDLGYDAPTVASVTPLWAAAEWLEREQYDLFGIHFAGHRDLRRLLLPEDWDGHPLLKSYKYPDAYHGIDHYRPDPKDQFKALDDLVVKAREAAKAQAAPKAEVAAPVEATAAKEPPKAGEAAAGGAAQATEADAAGGKAPTSEDTP